MKKITSALLCAALMLSLACPAFAAEQTAELDRATAYLRQSGVMVGDEHGEMNLDRGINRAEMATILARMTVNQEHLAADQAYYIKQCTFSDVPEWAKAYVGFCASNHMVAGYGNGTYGSNDPVTPAAACTVMLRCLNEAGTDWGYDTACQTAVELGLASAEILAGTEISRGNMAILVYRTMAKMGYEIEVPDSSESPSIVNGISYNADGSINIPTDGSQYVPKAGDVIRCDDGANYAITDVSRYDKNMFASGPVGDLPKPTCDWSLLPQPELPMPEVRHFTLANGEYMFIRNLYETRRMLYTLYNAIGENPETWQDGKPTLHPSGNPKIRISLMIGDDTAAESFWPWRESEIVDPFNSNPCGTHSLEAWDVYKNGIFQRTEYMVHHVT